MPVLALIKKIKYPVWIVPCRVRNLKNGKKYRKTRQNKGCWGDVVKSTRSQKIIVYPTIIISISAGQMSNIKTGAMKRKIFNKLDWYLAVMYQSLNKLFWAWSILAHHDFFLNVLSISSPTRQLLVNLTFPKMSTHENT